MPVRLTAVIAIMAIAACGYGPGADVVSDGPDEAADCQPLPSDIPELVPIETVTGYDPEAGVAGDVGVIHHEAYLVRGDGRNSMLSFQDFRGPEADRTDSTMAIVTSSYLDCTVCVLLLLDCPHESLAGCRREFLAVRGTVTFHDFQKAADSWNVEGLEHIDVTLSDLELAEVAIDTSTYATVFACEGEHCAIDPPEECLDVGTYSFTYTAPP